MNIVKILLFATALFPALFAVAQSRPLGAEKNVEAGTADAADLSQPLVVVTGARFSYALVQKWIDEYNKVNPAVQIIIESRGATDPLQYDIVAEVSEHEENVRRNREYIHVARYAILPVANSRSLVAKVYADQGLSTDLIHQIYFYNIFSDRDKQKTIQTPFTAYTRLQKAGAPAVFAAYFGYKQKDLKGTAIAGSDAHLLKAVLRDSSAVTYLPLPLVYDLLKRKPLDGLVVLPVDLNGNKKVNDDEKFYHTIDAVIERLEAETSGRLKNVAIGYLHLSVDKKQASAEAVAFLKWVNENGRSYLHAFGYLAPGELSPSQDTFNEFVSQRAR